MSKFWIREGDAYPVITSVLTGSDGNPIPLDNATGVNLEVRDRLTGAVVLDQAGSIPAPKSQGKVTYDWATKISTAGSYAGFWIITWSGGGEQSFPTDVPMDIIVASATGFVDGFSPDTLLEVRRKCGEVGDTVYTDNDLARILTKRTGEVAAAVYDVWTFKAADAANLVNQRDSSSSRDFSDLMDHCMSMAAFWARQSPTVTAELTTGSRKSARTRPIERA